MNGAAQIAMTEAGHESREHTMTVITLSADTIESTSFVDGWLGPPYTRRDPAVRVRLEGEQDVRGEFLCAPGDAPKIGDTFSVTFVRSPR
jgi:hypothetical protein